MPHLTDKTRATLARLDSLEAHRRWCRDWRQARRLCKRSIRLGLAEASTAAAGLGAIAAHIAVVWGA